MDYFTNGEMKCMARPANQLQSGHHDLSSLHRSLLYGHSQVSQEAPTYLLVSNATQATHHSFSVKAQTQGTGWTGQL